MIQFRGLEILTMMSERQKTPKVTDSFRGFSKLGDCRTCLTKDYTIKSNTSSWFAIS
jgi:hypothetical protein